MGKCLTCGRESNTGSKDKRKCGSCWKKQRLKAKANKRGKSRYHYLSTG